MAKIPVNTHTTQNIIENAPDKREWPGRSYLSMSAIGDECKRKLFYTFRWVSPKIISVQKQRIFERGFLEEPRIIKSLKEHGMQVFRLDKDDSEHEIFGNNNEEQEEFTACHGHVKGHPDGRVRGVIESPKTVHLLEMKALKESYFNKLVKHGLKKALPKYWAQITRYMSVAKLERTLFVATNKNNEDRIYLREELDSDFNKELERKEFDIVTAESAEQFDKFPRAYIECKWCEHFHVCHNNDTPIVSCRTCRFVDLAKDGVWICTQRDNLKLSINDQKAGCGLYKRGF